ncbi:MAG: hypothetical protein V1644_03445 [Candidatus Micrarchaeota archaeon]
MYAFILIPILFIFSIPGLAKAWKTFQTQKTNAEIERTMPDLLIHLSGFSTSPAPFQIILDEASNFNGPASKPFKKCKNLIEKGCPVQTAISTSFSIYPPSIRKTGDLFRLLYTNGNSTLVNMGEFGFELSKQREVKESLKADASIQKYSLLAACAFLVPFIIALIYSVSSKAVTLLPASVGVANSNNVVLLAINVYLILFAFISSKFLSRQFSMHYISFFSMTCPLSLLVFNFALLFL